MPYQPIPCAQHERLEFSVLRRIPLRIEYHDHGAVIRECALPVDVATREGSEWLTLRRESGELKEIRLDRIVDFHEQQGGCR
ncbi:MAG: transcriptional antiterminator, Rof [Sulfuricellaceae bacterium]|nr:transcriptional antiterminator, Rof [Sulfuricellaceae bacterium]